MAEEYSSNDLQDYFDYVLPLVKDAGQVIKGATDRVAVSKVEEWDLVTIYDKKVEEILIRKLRERYPHHRFIGEEDSALKNEIPELTDSPTWIIDPIDGTANFVIGLPMSCVSVGLTINKEPVLGITYNPFLEELYTAVKGKGAYLNGQRLYTSSTDDPSKAIVAIEISLARNEKFTQLYLDRLQSMLKIIPGIRAIGSAALSLCYVARGVLDAYECTGLMPWDVAAGAVLIKEAGGSICNTDGTTLNIMTTENKGFMAAGNKILLHRLVDILQV